MERRFVAFLALSFLVLMLNSMLFGPERPDPKLGKPNEVAEREGAVAVEEDKKVAVAAEPEESSPAGNAAKEIVVQQDVDLQYVTLGSIDEESPFRMLVTFTNQGAGVRRIELASPRFRDLHDRGGYLGHLECVPAAEGGVLVQAVGAGTPAEQAGLQPGMRILKAGPAGEQPMSSADDLKKILAKTKQGKPFVLQVVDADGKPSSLPVALQRHPLDILRPESENVLLRTDKLPKGFLEPPSFLLTLQQLGTARIAEEAEELAGITLRETHWEIAAQDETSVTFRQGLPEQGIEVLKSYRLEKVPAEKIGDQDYPGYGLTLEIEIRNLGEAAREIAYRLDGPNGLPIEGWWYSNKIGRNWGAAGLRDVVARFEGGDPVQFFASDIADDDAEVMEGSPLAFVGVDAKYFSVAMLPKKPSLGDLWIEETHSVLLSPEPKAPIEGRYANVTCRLLSRPVSLEPGGTLRHSYTLFAGPKRPELLAQYRACENNAYTLSDMLYYGWFGTVAKAMLGIMHFFYGIVGNYGVAIIMLTVLVRSCMFPMSRKQVQSMAKMQALKPELDRMKEKYKGDMQKSQQAMQDLYRKHKINPLAGCMPVLIQMPIFLGLYRALMVDVELRQAPFLGEAIRWCSDLSAPDMFYDWSSFMPDWINKGEGITGLGPYLNILPLVTVALFMLQQKMFMPEPANEQAAMQQKIMKYMMLFMGFMFFKVASGLCLYFIASSAWGIAERKLLPTATVASAENSTAAPGAKTAKKKPSSSASKNGQAKSKNRAKSKRKR